MITTALPPDQIPTIPGLIIAASLCVVFVIARWADMRRTP